jgi:hypothetical protein
LSLRGVFVEASSRIHDLHVGRVTPDAFRRSAVEFRRRLAVCPTIVAWQRGRASPRVAIAWVLTGRLELRPGEKASNALIARARRLEVTDKPSKRAGGWLLPIVFDRGEIRLSHTGAPGQLRERYSSRIA